MKLQWITKLARLGYLAKGLVYLIVGVLTALVVVDDRTLVTTKVEALQLVLKQPLGLVALWALVAGLSIYVLWRLAQGIFDLSDRGSSMKGLSVRGAYMVNGLFYATLVVAGVELLTGSPARIGLGQEDWTDWLLSELFGRVLVSVGGLVLVGVGFVSAYRAYTARFRKDLELGELGNQPKRWLVGVGQVGIGARSLTYIATGVLLVRAAITVQPQLTNGMASLFDALLAAPFGRIDLMLVALGLAVYGLHQIIKARYRTIA